MAMAAVPASGAVEVPPKSVRTATAVCKPGQIAVSSGFQAPDFALSNDSGVARIGVQRPRTA